MNDERWQRIYPEDQVCQSMVWKVCIKCYIFNLWKAQQKFCTDKCVLFHVSWPNAHKQLAAGGDTQDHLTSGQLGLEMHPFLNFPSESKSWASATLALFCLTTFDPKTNVKRMNSLHCFVGLCRIVTIYIYKFWPKILDELKRFHAASCFLQVHGQLKYHLNE